jgi:hypothetical protein
MTIWRVVATMETDLQVFVEADTEDEAYNYARDLDGGEFTEIEGGGDWNINYAALDTEGNAQFHTVHKKDEG